MASDLPRLDICLPSANDHLLLFLGEHLNELANAEAIKEVHALGQIDRHLPDLAEIFFNYSGLSDFIS